MNWQHGEYTIGLPKKGSIINIRCELLPSCQTQNIIFAMVYKFKKKFEMVKENLVLGSQHIIKKSISTILTKVTKTQKKLVMIMQTWIALALFPTKTKYKMPSNVSTSHNSS